MQTRAIVNHISATDAKDRFTELVNGTAQRAEHHIINRDGVPVAVLVPIAEYEKYIDSQMAAEEAQTMIRKEVAVARMQTFLVNVHQEMPDVPEDEVDQDIAEAIRTIRNNA